MLSPTESEPVSMAVPTERHAQSLPQDNNSAAVLKAQQL
jgi:hypothetical protein